MKYKRSFKMSRNHTLRATVYIDVEVTEGMIKRHNEVRKSIQKKLEYFLKGCKSLHDYEVCEIDQILDIDLHAKWNEMPHNKKIYLDEYRVTLRPDETYSSI